MSAISGPGSTRPADSSTPADDSSSTGAATTAPASSIDRSSGGARLAVAASTAGTGIIRGLRVAPDATSYVEGALARLSSAQAREARRLLKQASGIDGNLVLTRAEAEKAIAPVLSALPGGAAAVADALRDVDAEIERERLREAEVRDGVEVLFNSEPRAPSMSARVTAELDAAVAEAAGRRLDVSVMIFSFTDQRIADKLVDIARANPNAHIRIVADWSQTTTANGYKPAALARLNLPNLEVKFKKDQPYKWDAATGRLKWDHATSRGLNHHKGLVTMIDGRPRKLVAGSFNWSPTADNQNYENLMVLDAAAAANRRVMRHYGEEFEAYWNEGRASLTLAEAAEHKRRIERAFAADPGVAPASIEGLPAGAGASISLLAPDDILDLNSWTAGDRIAALLGGGQQGLEIARAMQAERLNYGRFRDLDDLVARVPAVGRLGAGTRARLGGEAVFGDGAVPVNEAGADELAAVGLSRPEAEALVRARGEKGDFESLDAARAAAGVTPARWARVARHLTGEVRRVAFSARMPHEARGDAGYARTSEARTVPVVQPDGTVALESAVLGAGAVDILRRVPAGDTVKIAVYGLSAGTPEYAALVEAARRGAKVRIVLNKASNEPIAASLKQLARDEGLDVAVKTSSRTMHQKYLVHVEGQDAFNGSANLSGSSATRHSEDRFFLKNSASIARAFEADFDRLWGRLPP